MERLEGRMIVEKCASMRSTKRDTAQRKFTQMEKNKIAKS